ncbi:hypothetical protein MPTK1_6g13000 [Marchantia polymorpha subsp. ruderalis]|uniref:Fungal lipase-type domain-containing protein n=1 Tax=Marchantia polymorpha subsp. ruderalis TaxID=1480154 RepID=A0AAF6BRI1_MARPO|nr:hypothetical protein Mp_6g13000 [Marchantia polymorpha subsp. ruderalis]
MAGVVIWGLLGYFGYNYYHNWRKAAAKENVPRMNPNGNEWQDDETIWITKRFIYARLVYGIYDRFKRAERYEEWWTAMQYQRVKLAAVLSEDEQEVYKDALQYERTHKYFGVFQLTTNSPPANALKWVVAIRGTDFSRTADLLNNLSIVFEQLNSAQLTTIVEVVVRRLVAQHGYQSVGVTGHSLGAAVGLLVCRRLALERCLVEGHFFNPPFAHLKSLVLRLTPMVLRTTIDGVEKYAYELLEEDTDFARQRALQEFQTLAEGNWYPYLYVNEYDFICNQYLEHFEHGAADDDREKCFPFAYLNTIRRERHFFARVTAHKLRIWLRSDVPGRFEQVELIQRP